MLYNNNYKDTGGPTPTFRDWPQRDKKKIKKYL